jgi:hypothetical protein
MTMDDCVAKIRDYINGYPFKQRLLNGRYWMQLCGSMDVIEDAQMAIDFYTSSDAKHGFAEHYLRLYGLLQALYLQQDATMHLLQALGSRRKLLNNRVIRLIRNARNESIGHPSKSYPNKKKKLGEAVHFMSRDSLSKDGFKLMSSRDKKTKFLSIPVTSFMEQQRQCLASELENLIEILKRKKRKHKERFKVEKLERIFDHAGYACEKIHLNLGRGKHKDARFGASMVRSLQEALDTFHAALIRRSMKKDTFAYYELEYALSELLSFYETRLSKKQGKMSIRAASIFAYYVDEHIRVVKSIAQEIDKEYASEDA